MMQDVEVIVDPELQAMSEISIALSRLGSEDAKLRALNWALGKFGLNKSPHLVDQNINKTPGSSESFEAIADLFDTAHPTTSAEKSLVVGYWLQVVMGNVDFGSQSVNKELKNLGHGISNITSALSELIKQKQVLQITKAGKSQQARKKYKLTRLGIQRVEAMFKGEITLGGGK
ncbi:MAG: hypothetical protein K0S29_1273 [Gammaproteobacteria bacterium]|jgi:hypothetical protein|nr:hypothetical protein [Gammaproteobacteria bacterium]